MSNDKSDFPTRLFGILAIVIGVFIVLGGGCFVLLGAMFGGGDPLGFIGLLVGVGLVIGGTKMVRSTKK
jgi:hypothetical protein